MQLDMFDELNAQMIQTRNEMNNGNFIAVLDRLKNENFDYVLKYREQMKSANEVLFAEYLLKIWFTIFKKIYISPTQLMTWMLFNYLKTNGLPYNCF